MTSIHNRLEPASSGAGSAKPMTAAWRTPTVVVGFGCLIALLSFGPRSSLGFFLTPLSSAVPPELAVSGLVLGIAVLDTPSLELAGRGRLLRTSAWSEAE